jgi:Ca2+-transporting ATPase
MKRKAISGGNTTTVWPRMDCVFTKRVESSDAAPYEDLTLLGLVGMMDPPRQDVKQAIALCRDAGLRVVMVTGDQAQTAVRIASDMGLLENDDEIVMQGSEVRPAGELSESERDRLLQTSIFARVSP